jgi:diguanylate cyclase (GGDEF)-like protein
MVGNGDLLFERKVRKYLVYIYGTLGASYLYTFGVLYYLRRGDYVSAFFEIAAGTVFVIALVVFTLTKRYMPVALLMNLNLFAVIIYLATTGGIQNTGLFWIYSFPLATTFMLGIRLGLVLSLLLVLCILGVYALGEAGYMRVAYDLITVRQAIAAYIGVLIMAVVYNVVINRYVSLVVQKTLEIHNLNRKLKEIAEKDFLTGAVNRYKLFQILHMALENALETGRPLSLVLFDFDRFKDINDSYGHQVGDRVLREVIRRVKDTLRDNDIVGRYGGEEFLVILTDTPLHEAVKVAERIRKMVESLEFPEGFRVTVSCGVSQMKPEDSLEAMIKRADEALYRAKERGRNRTEVSP